MRTCTWYAKCEELLKNPFLQFVRSGPGLDPIGPHLIVSVIFRYVRMTKMFLLLSFIGFTAHGADTVADPTTGFKAFEPVAEETKPVEIKPLPSLNVPKFSKAKKSKKKKSSTASDVSPVDVVERINAGNQAVKKIKEQNDRCVVCELNDKAQTTGASETRADELIKMKKQFDSLDSKSEGALVEPKTDVNSTNTRVAVCGERPGNYQACIYNGDVVPGQIRLNNRTNTPLPREWQFDFAGQARQDLGISISDYNDNAYSKSQFTYMMVFPRRYLPSIRTDGDQQIVTLPTGETVTYDTKTKKVLGGALTDAKTYTGSNVVIKVDATGKEPRLGKGSATISKNGKSCKVPLKSLWPDQSDSSMLHFKYSTDQEFDDFLKTQKCGFSVY